MDSDPGAALGKHRNSQEDFREPQPDIPTYMKRVKFNGLVRVVLIPNLVEYMEANLFPSLWWNVDEFRAIKKSAVQEIKAYISTRPGMDAKQAIKFLYQNSAEECDLPAPLHRHSDPTTGSSSTAGSEEDRNSASSQQSIVTVTITPRDPASSSPESDDSSEDTDLSSILLFHKAQMKEILRKRPTETTLVFPGTHVLRSLKTMYVPVFSTSSSFGYC